MQARFTQMNASGREVNRADVSFKLPHDRVRIPVAPSIDDARGHWRCTPTLFFEVPYLQENALP